MSRRNTVFAAWLGSPPPTVAVQLTAAQVTAVALSDAGDTWVVAAHATEPLPAALVTPGLNAPNVGDVQALAAAIAAVLQRLGQRTRRVALVLPDSLAKVSLIRFEKVPAKAQDLEQLIRWQVRKTAPFRIEDAQVSWQAGLAVPGGGREYLVTLARRDIVQAYERACDVAGVHAGLVDITSVNQINAVLCAGPIAGDWLLVSVAADYATLAVVRGEHVVFFRNRAAGTEGDLADLVHQTAMYHEDRLGGGGFTRVVLAGAATLGLQEWQRLQRLLQERIGMAVDPVDFRPAAELRDRIGAGPELLDALAPSIGVLLRERRTRGRAGGAATEQVA